MQKMSLNFHGLTSREVSLYFVYDAPGGGSIPKMIPKTNQLIYCLDPSCGDL